jgi:hypothetical protein
MLSAKKTLDDLPVMLWFALFAISTFVFIAKSRSPTTMLCLDMAHTTLISVLLPGQLRYGMDGVLEENSRLLQVLLLRACPWRC